MLQIFTDIVTWHGNVQILLVLKNLSGVQSYEGDCNRMLVQVMVNLANCNWKPTKSRNSATIQPQNPKKSPHHRICAPNMIHLEKNRYPLWYRRKPGYPRKKLTLSFFCFEISETTVSFFVHSSCIIRWK